LNSLRRFLVLALALPLVSVVPASWGAAGEGAPCEQASAQWESLPCCDALASTGAIDCSSGCGAGHCTAAALMPETTHARIGIKGAPQIGFERLPSGALLHAPDTAPPRLTLA
jgi:hypothetical protein